MNGCLNTDMAVKTPNVSICIPTRSRLHYLKQMLPALLAQAQSLGMQVCVSDNASTDGTVDYLQEMSAQFPCLKFIRHHESLTLDESMHAAIRMAENDYVFPIGDDDFLLDNALTLIVEELKKLPDLLILNAIHTGPNLEPSLEHLPESAKYATFTSPKSAFVVLHLSSLHFGAFLAKKTMYVDQIIEKYYGTNHAYAGVIWDSLLNIYVETDTCFVKCMSSPTVYLRGGEKSWEDSRVKLFLNDMPLWFSLLPEVYQEETSKILKGYVKYVFKFSRLLRFKSSGQLNGKLISDIGNTNLNLEIKHRLFLYIVRFLPVCVARITINFKDKSLETRKSVSKMVKR